MPVFKGAYPREHTGDPQIDRMQQELVRLRGILARCPFIDGSLVEGEELTTTPAPVAHGLGRRPRGVIVVSASPDGAVGLSASQPTDTRQLVHVEASASITASLWFW